MGIDIIILLAATLKGPVMTEAGMGHAATTRHSDGHPFAS